ncbi:MAG: hypothetical protein GYB64_02930 [Chloroflexi bacterium]|nr:hypothetical protein [Chloroflexota bacterium]
MLGTVLALGTMVWLGFNPADFTRGYFGFHEDVPVQGWVLHQAFINLEAGRLGQAPIFYPMPDAFGTTVALYGIAVPFFPVWSAYVLVRRADGHLRTVQNAAYRAHSNIVVLRAAAVPVSAAPAAG